MRYHNPLIVLSSTLLLGFSTLSHAASETDSASIAADEKRQAELQIEYQHVLAEAKKQRLEAEVAMEKARQQLQLATEQKSQQTAEIAAAQAVRKAEMAKMHDELGRQRRQLREVSREIARVNREVARARMAGESASFVFNISDRPIIGLILGEADDVGITVLGVSPDGPAERAGVEPGDVILALGGRVLAAVDETGSVREGLEVALKDLKVDEPVIVSVVRADQTLDLTVVPEVREPLSWKSIVRFPSVASAPSRKIRIETIEIPEIDSEALKEQIEHIRIVVAQSREAMEAGVLAPSVHDFEFNFEFSELSELGDFVLHDANVWFGLPLAQGLKLAEIDPDLGEYFKTDRGVLVLKAKADNELQLESGDVILQVGATEVDSPADFMRALREFEPGEELQIDIKRKRKSRTLTLVMPARQARYFVPHADQSHTIRITTDRN